ncbi:chromosome replication initiation inhibitor protein [Legionella santicrucis]|uniref:Chromosome replication initiation inhibitor protein n=2 Tax=Legionella santicrucis TaxID=45074 RepID=A0A0W0YFW2_9GAMM|nr:chromosome replication initiation inhibitor protein [Legionella santicrucis]
MQVTHQSGKLCLGRLFILGNKRFKRDFTNKRVIDFDESDPMTLNYLKYYDLLKHIRPERHFVNVNESLLSLFINGYGFGVLSTELCQPYLDKKELVLLNSGLSYENKLVLAWYTRTGQPSYFSDVIDLIV